MKAATKESPRQQCPPPWRRNRAGGERRGGRRRNTPLTYFKHNDRRAKRQQRPRRRFRRLLVHEVLRLIEGEHQNVRVLDDGGKHEWLQKGDAGSGVEEDGDARLVSKPHGRHSLSGPQAVAQDMPVMKRLRD